MSHFSKIKTQFKNRETLIETLKNSGFQITEGENLKIDMKYRIDGSHTEKVDFIVNVEGLDSKNFMGVRLNEGVYEIVGDSYGVRDSGGRRFEINSCMETVKVAYAEKEINRQFKEIPELAEFDLVNRVIDPTTREVVLTYQRWN